MWHRKGWIHESHSWCLRLQKSEVPSLPLDDVTEYGSCPETYGLSSCSIVGEICGYEMSS